MVAANSCLVLIGFAIFAEVVCRAFIVMFIFRPFFDFDMNSVNMFPQIVIVRGFVIALPTGKVPYLVMNAFDMTMKKGLLSCTVVTLPTEPILNLFMNKFYVFPEGPRI